MCRTDLGECVGEGCTNRATCQDNHGWCNEHSPYNITFCDCEGDCICPPPPPSPQVNEVKRLRYDISRTERYVEQQRMAERRARENKRDAVVKLSRMRDRLLIASSPDERGR